MDVINRLLLKCCLFDFGLGKSINLALYYLGLRASDHKNPCFSPTTDRTMEAYLKLQRLDLQCIIMSDMNQTILAEIQGGGELVGYNLGPKCKIRGRFSAVQRGEVYVIFNYINSPTFNG